MTGGGGAVPAPGTSGPAPSPSPLQEPLTTHGPALAEHWWSRHAGPRPHVRTASATSTRRSLTEDGRQLQGDGTIRMKEASATGKTGLSGQAGWTITAGIAAIVLLAGGIVLQTSRRRAQTGGES